MPNNRQTPRQPASAPATLESGTLQVSGVLLDVSATGARLRLTPGAFLSNHCVLTTTLFSEAVPSRIVWRRGAEVGLRFKTMVNLREALGAARARSTGSVEPGFGGGFGRRIAQA